MRGGKYQNMKITVKKLISFFFKIRYTAPIGKQTFFVESNTVAVERPCDVVLLQVDLTLDSVSAFV